MRAKPVASETRRHAADSLLSMRPCGLAGNQWEPAFAAGYAALLLAVFVAEILTPTAVVSVLGLIPLMLALWTLSDRFAGLVAALVTVELAAALIIEPTNRTTVALVALAALLVSCLTRLCARNLAPVLANQDHVAGRRARNQAPDGLHAIQPFVEQGKALTRREQEVAGLAARAFTATEIGDQLHIGHRTVETHLAAIYGKLLIRSRGELIRMISTQPEPDHRGRR